MLHPPSIKKPARAKPEPDRATLIVQWGTPVPSGFMLAPKDIAAFDAWARRTLERLHKLRGTFVSVADTTITSVYRPAKPKRRRLLEQTA